jgi:hypothetical protein
VVVAELRDFTFAQLHAAANMKAAVAFLHALAEAVPYKIYTALNRQRRAVL